ncbi:MAG: BlaI/MecI/CopY family transcriptional regulator [Candidatus Daviesbacteria bacterium]
MLSVNKLSLFHIANSLGSLEEEIMKIVWRKQKLSVRETLAVLKNKKYFAYTTIMTVMDHLYKKGFLTREKVEKTYYYSPKHTYKQLITNSLFKTFHELISDYGRRKILYFAINTSFPFLPKLTIFPYFSNKLVINFKAPVGYSTLLTIFLILFVFSAYDLLQNLTFYGTFDYLNLFISEPSILMNRIHLFIPAFLDSLPIINILTTVVSTILVIIFTKKLFKLLKFHTSFSNLMRVI